MYSFCATTPSHPQCQSIMITPNDDSIAAGTSPGPGGDEIPMKQPDQQPPSEHGGDASPNDDDLDAKDDAKDEVKKDDNGVAEEDMKVTEEEEKKEDDQDDELEDEDDKKVKEHGDEYEYEYPLSDAEDKDVDDDDDEEEEEEKKAHNAVALHDMQLESQKLKDLLTAWGYDVSKVAAAAKELAESAKMAEVEEEKRRRRRLSPRLRSKARSLSLRSSRTS